MDTQDDSAKRDRTPTSCGHHTESIHHLFVLLYSHRSMPRARSSAWVSPDSRLLVWLKDDPVVGVSSAVR